MGPNKVRLNPDKMTFLVEGPNFNLGIGEILMMDKVRLPLKDQVHSQEMLLQPALLLGKQIAMVARNAFYQLGLVLEGGGSCLHYTCGGDINIILL